MNSKQAPQTECDDSPPRRRKPPGATTRGGWGHEHSTPPKQPQLRRRAVCVRCQGVEPPEYVGRTHRHGRKAVTLVPRMVRLPLYPVEQADIERGVRWLERVWGSGVFVPDQLRDVAVA